MLERAFLVLGCHSERHRPKSGSLEVFSKTRISAAMLRIMTPPEFVAKWKSVSAKESAASKVHFEELCRLLGVPGPLEEDPSGQTYTYEKHVRKATGKKGFADVWRRGCFGWEYKGKDTKDLRAAYVQLLGYKDDLENPPLLVGHLSR